MSDAGDRLDKIRSRLGFDKPAGGQTAYASSVTTDVAGLLKHAIESFTIGGAALFHNVRMHPDSAVIAVSVAVEPLFLDCLDLAPEQAKAQLLHYVRQVAPIGSQLLLKLRIEKKSCLGHLKMGGD